ncbi:MAG: signal peptidase II [Anaerolineales bacterium]|nr:signal peptidase II [Anaerolineales bacterium]MCW5854519.1 signal peptidase II [Anaerolineales bacterium]
MTESPPSTTPQGSSLLHAYLSLFAVAGGIIALDQWTKGWIREHLAFGDSLTPWPQLPFLRLLHWKNTGAAFGMFQEGGGIFAILAVLVALMILYYFPRIPREEWALRLAMSLQLAGALGNLIDRLRLGYVTDFVAVGGFPIFNVADASISIGVALLLLSLWLNGDLDSQKEKAASEQLASD